MNKHNSTRIAVKLPALLTRDDAESAMNDLALSVNNQRKLTASRDGKCLLINQAYESQLGELDQAIKASTDAIRAWAEANPDAFPKDRKSLSLLSGTIGFRTGNPKLTLLSRAFNWDTVLAHVLQSIGIDYIRTKREVDKEALLSRHSQATDKAAADAELKRVGLKVTQDESFYIEPKLTEIESRQVSNN